MSKLVTKNDLTSILNEVLPIPQGTQYELIWTNPNGNSQTSTMGASTITANTSLSKYDGFMAEFRCYYNTGDKTYGFNMKGMSGMFSKIITVRSSGNPIIEYTRIWYPSSDTQFTISDCTRITSNSADVTEQDTGCLVPIRIWGIILKATGVSPIQEDYIVEQGTDGIWTYRKWNSGVAECWGNPTVTVTLSTVATYYHRGMASFSLPSSLFNGAPTVVIECNNGFWSGLQSVSATSVSAYFFDVTNASSYSLGLMVNVKGTWK
jgi:hypothetical protein